MSSKSSYLWDVAAGLPVILTDTNSIYVYGLSLLARQTGSDIQYYHTDALGSARSLTNGSGQNVGAYSFKPFGEPLVTSGTSFNRCQYTGQLNDPQTGSYYLRARYYQGGAGRFTAADTIAPKLDDSRSLNRFAYVQNNPIRFNDPTGHESPDGCGDMGCGSWAGPWPISPVRPIGRELLEYLYRAGAAGAGFLVWVGSSIYARCFGSEATVSPDEAGKSEPQPDPILPPTGDATRDRARLGITV